MLSLYLGLGGGLNVFTPRFDGDGRAPPRTTAAPFVELAAGAELGLPLGLYAGADVSAETHFVPLQPAAASRERTEVAFALSSALAFGKRF